MTPDGVLYEKEHILECLLHQKKDIARKLKLWEEQEAKEADKAAMEEHQAHEVGPVSHCRLRFTTLSTLSTHSTPLLTLERSSR